MSGILCKAQRKRVFQVDGSGDSPLLYLPVCSAHFLNNTASWSTLKSGFPACFQETLNVVLSSSTQDNPGILPLFTMSSSHGRSRWGLSVDIFQIRFRFVRSRTKKKFLSVSRISCFQSVPQAKQAGMEMTVSLSYAQTSLQRGVMCPLWLFRRGFPGTKSFRSNYFKFLFRMPLSIDVFLSNWYGEHADFCVGSGWSSFTRVSTGTVLITLFTHSSSQTVQPSHETNLPSKFFTRSTRILYVYVSCSCRADRMNGLAFLNPKLDIITPADNTRRTVRL